MPRPRSYARLTSFPPPPCLPHVESETCNTHAFFRPDEAAFFGIAPTAAESVPWERMRILFVDGHSGPMNDMMAMFQAAGVGQERMQAMVFGQANQKVRRRPRPQRSFVGAISAAAYAVALAASTAALLCRLTGYTASRRKPQLALRSMPGPAVSRDHASDLSAVPAGPTFALTFAPGRAASASL